MNSGSFRVDEYLQDWINVENSLAQEKTCTVQCKKTWSPQIKHTLSATSMVLPRNDQCHKIDQPFEEFPAARGGRTCTQRQKCTRARSTMLSWQILGRGFFGFLRDPPTSHGQHFPVKTAILGVTINRNRQVFRRCLSWGMSWGNQ